MGGRVEQVPERAPARLVTSREVKSEIELVRFGNDVTLDTNLLADPESFQVQHPPCPFPVVCSHTRRSSTSSAKSTSKKRNSRLS